ncbi:hypothetical protein JBL43_16590 [Aureibaculum sp. A20]|uniref:Uncharacterized protein n=1 Tax=Aureibaculum flavum TaxID=2795986 RepID=A0ABS0WV64_9FLAO|nr:hypothetical protein [Aureibaculum flavum]MBJ2175874.1 hypothetical protein [Aureibaculum flavum]
MRTVLLTLLFSISFLLSYGQKKFSNHTLHFFKNNTEKKIKASEISILVDGNKITGEKNGELYQFPIIDSTKTFEFIVKINNVAFKAGPYESWFLNSGSEITLGVLTKIDELLSVAEYNGIKKQDEEFDLLSKRFFIVNNKYTIDINAYKKIKRLDFLIINPHQKGDGSYVLTQRIIDLKK